MQQWNQSPRGSPPSLMEKKLRQIRSAAYSRVHEIQGQADAVATCIYGNAYNQNPDLHAFLWILESYKEKTNKNFILNLTTASDFYRYIKQAIPNEVQSRTAMDGETTPIEYSKKPAGADDLARRTDGTVIAGKNIVI